VAATRKSGLKARLSQNLMTFWSSVQRLIAGGFGEKAVNLGERKLVIQSFLHALFIQIARASDSERNIRVRFEKYLPLFQGTFASSCHLLRLQTTRLVFDKSLSRDQF
jgi:hypothetical protein